MKKWEIWKCEINQSNIEILTLTLLDYVAYLNWRCSLPEFRTLSVFLLNRAYLWMKGLTPQLWSLWHHVLMHCVQTSQIMMVTGMGKHSEESVKAKASYLSHHPHLLPLSCLLNSHTPLSLYDPHAFFSNRLEMSLGCSEAWWHAKKAIVILGAREKRRNLWNKVPSTVKTSGGKGSDRPWHEFWGARIKWE